MSMGIDGSANASVGADGSASAGGSIGGGIGSTLAGALSGSLSAGIGVAGSVALNAAANFAATANFSVALLAGPASPAAAAGTRPPEIYPAFRFKVQFQGLGPMRFQSVGQIHASQNKSTPPASAKSPADQSKGPAAAKGPTAPPPMSVSQGGQGGASTRLPGIGWSWDELTLKRGVAKDGVPLLMWIMEWWKNPVIAIPKDLTVIMLDSEGKPAMTWTFKQTFPTEWTLAEFKSDSLPGGLAFETLKLAWAGTPELILG